MEASSSQNKFTVHAQNIGTLVLEMPSSPDQPMPSRGQEIASDDISPEKPNRKHFFSSSASSSVDLGIGANGFQVYRLEAFCDRLVTSAHHFQAVPSLKRLHDFQPGNVKTMLMLMECYIYLDKYDEAFEIAKKIRDAVLRSPRPEARDLIIEAAESRTGKKYFTSIIFLWCACAVYEAGRSSKDALDGISECLVKMDDVGQDVVDEMEKTETEDSKQYLESFCSVLSLLMNETECQLESLVVEDRDLHTRVLLRCLGHKAHCMLGLKHFEDAINLYQSCIDRMNQQFGSNASKSFMFGEFLFNAACSYFEIDDYDQGFAYIRMAHDSLAESQPMSAEERKRKKEMLECIADALHPNKERKVVSKVKRKFSKLFAKFRK